MSKPTVHPKLSQQKPQHTPLERLAETTVPAFERNEPRPNIYFQLKNCVIVDENEKKLDWNVLGAVIEMPLELTITGASTVKIVCEDPQFSLLNDPIFSKWMFQKKQVSKSSAQTFASRSIITHSKKNKVGEESEFEWVLPSRPIDLFLDGVWFRLAGFQTKETKLTLIFEDRVAAILREKEGPFRSIQRGHVTRAGFIKEIVEGVFKEKRHRRYAKGFKIFTPEKYIIQEIAEPSAVQASDLKTTSNRAFGPHSGVTVKGNPADSEQLAIMSAALRAAVTTKADRFAQTALLEILIDESECRMNSVGAEGALGPFQILPSNIPGTVKSPYNVEECATYVLEKGFGANGGLKKIHKTNSHLPPGEVAHIEQANKEPGNVTYERFRHEAEHAVDAFGGTTNTETGKEQTTVPGAYNFTRGPYETTWDCVQRLAQEVNWYAFVRDNALWYVSGDFLLAQRTQLTCERGKLGVEWVNVDVDIGARDNIAEVEVVARAHFWTALPGNAIHIARVGPAIGKWIVNKVVTDVTDRSGKVTITTQKPLPARPEPANEGQEQQEAAETGGKPSGQGKALEAFEAANKLSQLQLPYVYGGGHGSNVLGTVNAHGGLDCSASTCWCLHEAGMFPSTSPIMSGDFNKWGVPGKGKEMTVWYSNAHVYIEFTIPGHGTAQLNTNVHDPPGPGPRLVTLSEGTSWNGTNGAGSGGPFSPRHYPGT